MSVFQFFGLAVAAIIAGACSREIKLRIDRRKAVRRYDERVERRERIEAARERFDCRPWEQRTWVTGAGHLPREQVAVAVLLIADYDWRRREREAREAGE